MRESTTAAPLAWSRAFPAMPAQAQVARRFLSAILDGSPAADDAVLCLSELVSNTIIHSNSGNLDGRFYVRAETHGDYLRVEVKDEGGPWVWPARANEQHGRGLLIVSRLARDWGRMGDGATGWTVWFEIALLVPRPARAVSAHPAQLWTTVLDGQRLRQLRGQLGLSQERLAYQAGISITTVARLERQVRPHCRTRTLALLAAALGENPAAIIAPALPGFPDDGEDAHSDAADPRPLAAG
jgi:DNA-binding XRE family transcriptional regulator